MTDQIEALTIEAIRKRIGTLLSDIKPLDDQHIIAAGFDVDSFIHGHATAISTAGIRLAKLVLDLRDSHSYTRKDLRLDPDDYDLPDDLDDPKWSAAGKVHDWRNHVSEGIQKIWPTFNLNQRIALYLAASERAGAEEWD